MNEALFSELIDLVSERSGLSLPEQERKSFLKKIGERMKSLGISEISEYFNLLKQKSPEAELEWNELLSMLTTGESYFFRDPNQFSLLRNKVLPELIDRRKDLRCLRLWSAGCSSGEEPYSLAIILNELILDRQNWDILIIGTDINGKAIERAQTGVFSSWSLRTMEPEIRKRYFSKSGDSWALDERIREMVTFCRANLMEDCFPGEFPNVKSLDLILCRNVFIYFHGKALLQALKKFADFLACDGYLITGHGELLAENWEVFQPKIFGEQVVYEKRIAAPIPVFQPPPLKPQKIIEKEPPKPPPMENNSLFDETVEVGLMREDLEKSRFPAVIARGKKLLKGFPSLFDVYVLMTEAYSHSGDYDGGAEMCRKAIDLNPNSFYPHFLLAQIMEAKGKIQEAKDFLKKTMYLNPDFAPAYLELGKLYAREKNNKSARKMFTAAMDLLRKMPPETPVPPFKGVTARELVSHIESLLSE